MLGEGVRQRASDALTKRASLVALARSRQGCLRPQALRVLYRNSFLAHRSTAFKRNASCRLKAVLRTAAPGRTRSPVLCRTVYSFNQMGVYLWQDFFSKRQAIQAGFQAPLRHHRIAVQIVVGVGRCERFT